MTSKGFNIQQIKLISAITDELSRQVPGIAVNTRQFNAIVKAATDICEEMRKGHVGITPGMGLDAWRQSDETGSSSLYMASVLSGEFSAPLAIPHDADDFGRCVQLLVAAPELDNRPFSAPYLTPEWYAILANWTRWSTSYKEDGFYEELHAAYEAERRRGNQA